MRPPAAGKKLFAYDKNKTAATPIIKKPRILNIVWRLTFNFRKGILIRVFVRGILNHCSRLKDELYNHLQIYSSLLIDLVDFDFYFLADFHNIIRIANKALTHFGHVY